MKRTFVIVLVLMMMLGTAAVLAGCGESQTQEKQSLAKDLTGLQESLTELVNPDTYKSYDSFEAAWNSIQAEYKKVVADARKLKDTNWTDLQAAYNDLEKALGNVSSDQSLQQKANTIIVASTAFLTEIQQLINDVNPPK